MIFCKIETKWNRSFMVKVSRFCQKMFYLAESKLQSSFLIISVGHPDRREKTNKGRASAQNYTNAQITLIKKWTQLQSILIKIIESDINV